MLRDCGMPWVSSLISVKYLIVSLNINRKIFLPPFFVKTRYILFV